MNRTINAVLIAFLMPGYLLFFDSSSWAQTGAQAAIVESTDHVTNKYWEEYLLINPKSFRYANSLPHISAASGARNEDAEKSEVGGILQQRIENYRRVHGIFGLHRGTRDVRDVSSPGEFSVIARVTQYVGEVVRQDTLPIHRAGFNGEIWVRPSPFMQVHIRGRLENHGELYSQFDGRKWKKKLTGWFDNAALYFYKNGFFGSFGRSYLIWGPEQHDALLLSDNSSPFDRFWLGYEHKIFRFDYLIARIDDIVYQGQTMQRYISAHRLSFRKAGVFEIGLSELALYGGYNRPLEWHYINPFVPYYWEQYNRGTDDNLFLGADLAVYWPHQARFFGELLIDDFQIDFKSEPHQVGYKLGFDALEPFGLRKLFTKLSYTRINPTVYGQNRPQNLYLHYGQSIGYFGGNDQDRTLALARYHFDPKFDLELEYQFKRCGSGIIEQFSPLPLPYGVKFPSGIVERSHSASFAIKYLNSRLLEGMASFQYAHFHNYHNQCGVNKSLVGFDLRLSYNFQGLID